MIVTQSVAKSLDSIHVDVFEILRFALDDKREKKKLIRVNLWNLW